MNSQAIEKRVALLAVRFNCTTTFMLGEALKIGVWQLERFEEDRATFAKKKPSASRPAVRRRARNKGAR